MDPSSPATTGSPGHENIAFTPDHEKFRRFSPRILGLSPSISLHSNGVGDEDFDSPSSKRSMEYDNFGPPLLNVTSFAEPNEFATEMVAGQMPAGPPGFFDFRSSHRPLQIDFTTTSESPTPTLRIENIQNVTAPVLFKIFHEEGDIQEFHTGLLEQKGILVVTFAQLVDALVTFVKIKDGGQWSVNYSTQGSSFLVGNYHIHNQVICTVMSGLSSRNLVPSLYESVAALGELVDFAMIQQSPRPAFRFTFEDHHAATSVAAMLDGQYTKCFKVEIATNEIAPPPMDQNIPAGIIVTSEVEDQGIWSPRPRYGVQMSNQVSPLTSLGCVWRPTSRTSSEKSQLSPFSHVWDNNFSASPTSSRGFLSPGSPSFRSHSSVGSVDSRDSYRNVSPSPSYEPKRPSHLAVPGKNVINLERIAIGSDTRTTVMLRNIPNKVDQETLKEYIDETSRGLYNFLYLRIDFRNICNVGYAFINFLDPLDIIEFVKAKSGTRWNKFNSEKVLDVTYANIQGIDQLIEKFRNSSVMDQDPAYRPKLFHSSGPLAGMEAEFPPPNNLLKKCRSVTAAQQIGLFAPKTSPAHTKSSWRKKE